MLLFLLGMCIYYVMGATPMILINENWRNGTLQQTNFHYRVHKMLLNQSEDLWLSLMRFNVMVGYKT